MKRKRRELTLWDASKVNKHKTMWRWWNSIRRRNYTNASDHSECIDDLDTIMSHTSVSKVSKLQRNEKLMTTFSVGLKPTPFQKSVLNTMLRVTNHTYNWCLYLVDEKKIPPKQAVLQKIICKPIATYVEPAYRLENDGWFFTTQMLHVKSMACKNFCIAHKTAEARSSELTRKRVDGDCIRQGQIEIPKQYIRLMNHRDECVGPKSKHIVLMKNKFKTPIRINRKADKLPPFNHDIKITKRPDGKFILRIPCDPNWTRRNSSGDSFEKSVCGIDPGARTFATVYDPIGKIVYQVGVEEDKKIDIRPIHDKIDETSRHLSNAINRNQQIAVEQRKAQMRKLYLKRKTKVDTIHTTLCSHLVKHYQFVSLGKISVSKIVKKGEGGGDLPRRAKRDLLCWQHYRFRQRLLHRVTGTDCQVIVQNEAYTSKKCGLCGVQNKKLGGSETFVCNSCGYETHRDINGARNILLKTLKMFPFA